jgi:hypothetical protein
MATKTGELRETLMEAISAVKAKKMDADEATAISKLAAQINASLKVEIDAREQNINRSGTVGSLSIGE